MNLYREILDELENQRQELQKNNEPETSGLEYAVCLIKNVKSRYDKLKAQEYRRRRRLIENITNDDTV